MNDQLVLDTVRSLEMQQAVTADDVAAALETVASTIEPALDRLVTGGSLHTSVLYCRRGEHLQPRSIWFHSPDNEVVERFGPIAGLVEQAARPPSGADRREVLATLAS